MSQPILLTATTKTGRGAESKKSRMREITGTGEAFILALVWCLDVQLSLKYKKQQKKCLSGYTEEMQKERG